MDWFTEPFVTVAGAEISLSTLVAWLNYGFLTIGEESISVTSLLKLVLVMVASFWVARVFSSTFTRVASRNHSFHQATIYALSRLSLYVILTIGLLIGLTIIGINLTSLTVVFGALGIGIGFGLQPVVVNFISGIIILFERNLKVGDLIQLANGLVGRVKEINVRSTLITNIDNIDILVPNSEFINGQVINWTLRDRIIRIHIPFGVAYGSDKEKVREAAWEAINALEFTITDDPERQADVWMMGFGDSSLNFEMVVWVKPEALLGLAAVKSRYFWELESALKRHNITIPFPQRDLHLVSGFPAVDKSG